MGKKLAIKGHSTRGNEVIDLLEMLGGVAAATKGFRESYCYYISEDTATKYISWDYIGPEEIEKYKIFTLEEFLEKYPFKIGDKVTYTKFGDNCNDYPVTIESMEWTGTTIEYTFNDCVTCLAKDIRFYKKTNMKTDCEKCGLHFGSVRCFDEDCPNNTPKSNAVGLKDGKVIDCKVNKEIDINDEVKPIFKVGDEIVKADGLTNSYIVTGITSKYYSLVAPNNSGVGVLPVNEQDEYILVNRADDKEPEPKAPILSNRYDYADGKCGYVIPDGYEFDCIKEGFQTEIIIKPKKPTYPKTYKECCDVLGIDTMDNDAQGYKADLIIRFQELIIDRDAYWKIAGDELGLSKPWEPDFTNNDEERYGIYTLANKVERDFCGVGDVNMILSFPTEEMRDVFCDNFKKEIEQCKELL